MVRGMARVGGGMGRVREDTGREAWEMVPVGLVVGEEVREEETAAAMGVQAVASEAVGVRGGRAEEKGMRAAMVVQEAAKVGLAVAEGRGAATVMPQR